MHSTKTYDIALASSFAQHVASALSEAEPRADIRGRQLYLLSRQAGPGASCRKGVNST